MSKVFFYAGVALVFSGSLLVPLATELLGTILLWIAFILVLLGK